MVKPTATPKIASPEYLAHTFCRQPCQKGCGFFASPATKNLNSVCLTGFHLTRETATLPRIKVKSSNDSNTSCVFNDHLFSHADQLGMYSDSYDDHNNKQCQYFCDKNVGLLELRCRCGGRFCKVHRFPGKHACKYDYVAAGREDLMKQIPVCKADKLKTRV